MRVFTVLNGVQATFQNLTFWHGVAGVPNGGEIENSGGHNLIGDLGTSLFGEPCAIEGDQTGVQIGANPGLLPLADNGSPTEMHAISATSAALDAGDPSGCNDPDGAPLLADQRHALRVDRCDLGSYERGGLIEHLFLPVLVRE